MVGQPGIEPGTCGLRVPCAQFACVRTGRDIHEISHLVDFPSGGVEMSEYLEIDEVGRVMFPHGNVPSRNFEFFDESRTTERLLVVACRQAESNYHTDPNSTLVTRCLKGLFGCGLLPC